MGKRGPKPTPTAVLKLRGSWRADTRQGEMKVALGVPDCPTWLGEVAKAKWTELTLMLSGTGVLALVDKDVLARYCDTWERWLRAREIVIKSEVIVKRNEEGVITDAYIAPHTKIMKDLAAQLSKLEGEFGLTPAARTRVQTNENQKEGDTLARFRRMGGSA